MFGSSFINTSIINIIIIKPFKRSSTWADLLVLLKMGFDLQAVLPQGLLVRQLVVEAHQHWLSQIDQQSALTDTFHHTHHQQTAASVTDISKQLLHCTVILSCITALGNDAYKTAGTNVHTSSVNHYYC